VNTQVENPKNGVGPTLSLICRRQILRGVGSWNRPWIVSNGGLWH